MYTHLLAQQLTRHCEARGRVGSHERMDSPAASDARGECSSEGSQGRIHTAEALAQLGL